jgi:hypothetical protein
MKSRCQNKNSEKYGAYGARGIKVCADWQDFEKFKRDMYESYLAHKALSKGGTTIERKNTDGDYCKENCRWATYKEQFKNKRDTIHVEYQGKIVTLMDLREVSGIPRWVLYNRIVVQKLNVSEALKIPYAKVQVS